MARTYVLAIFVLPNEATCCVTLFLTTPANVALMNTCSSFSLTGWWVYSHQDAVLVELLNRFPFGHSNSRSSCSMVDVVLTSAPFEIADAVVLLVLVDMVDLWQVFSVGEKCLSNQSMNCAFLAFAILAEDDEQVALCVHCRLQQLDSSCTSVVQASDSPLVTDLIQALIA